MRKKIILGVLSAVICGSALIGIAPDTHAAAIGTLVFVLGEKPHRVEEYLDIGDSYTGTIKVENRNEEAATVTFTPVPYSYTEQGDDFIPDYGTETPYSALAKWITFPDGDEIDFEAGEIIDVPFTITVPKGAIAGTQASAILVHTVTEAEKVSETGVAAEANFAYVVFANINGDDLKEEGKIVEWESPSFLFSPPIKSRSVVENTGNIVFRVKYEFNVYALNDDREPVFTSEKNADVLPAGKRATFHYWDGAPLLGIFNVKEKISFLDDTYEYAKTVIICPLWLILIVIAFLVLAIILIIRRARQRKEDKSKLKISPTS